MCISLRVHHIKGVFKKNRRRGRQKFIHPQQEKAGCEERRRKIRVTVLLKMVVWFGELTPFELGTDNLAEQYTATFTKEN